MIEPAMASTALDGKARRRTQLELFGDRGLEP